MKIHVKNSQLIRKAVAELQPKIQKMIEDAVRKAAEAFIEKPLQSTQRGPSPIRPIKKRREYCGPSASLITAMETLENSKYNKEMECWEKEISVNEIFGLFVTKHFWPVKVVERMRAVDLKRTKNGKRSKSVVRTVWSDVRGRLKKGIPQSKGLQAYYAQTRIWKKGPENSSATDKQLAQVA